jgi:hypothetical protein
MSCRRFPGVFVLACLVLFSARGGIKPVIVLTDCVSGERVVVPMSQEARRYGEMVSFSAGTVEQVAREARRWRFRFFLSCKRISPAFFVAGRKSAFALIFFTRK